MPEAQPDTSDSAAAAFIARWAAAQSAERANYALFLSELCDLLEILQTLVTLGRARPGDAKGVERAEVIRLPAGANALHRMLGRTIIWAKRCGVKNRN